MSKQTKTNRSWSYSPPPPVETRDNTAALPEPKVFTKLIDKHHSPAILRKYTHWGFPIYIGLIADDDLSDLDEVIVAFMKANKSEGWVENIQKLRDMAGNLTEHLVEQYEHSESVAVIFYIDKMWVSSLYGDAMNHAACRKEVYDQIAISAHI